MESLKNVQKISKVLKILAKIVFICSIVACACCAISIPIIAVLGKDPQMYQWLIEAGEDYSYKRALCDVVTGTVATGFAIALYALVVRFYDTELKIGTPFDPIVVKKMRKLGWLHIILPICSVVAVAIVGACFKIDVSDMLGESGIVIGIVYLIVSFVLQYGADLKAQTPSNLQVESQAEQTTQSTVTEEDK